jgi:anti-sigma factor RsiW
MTHRDVWAQLDEFLDGALAVDARWTVAAHLDECAVCRNYVATQARLRGVVREGLMAVAPPPGLRGRLSSALAAEAMVPRADALRSQSSFPIRLVALLGPALAALWLVVALTVPAARSSAGLPRELVATHTLFAHDESLLDVAGDAATVTDWFRDTAGLQVSAPELANYTLAGGRLITLKGSPVAQLVYERTPDEVYLSLVQFTLSGTGPNPMGLRNGFALSQEGPMSLVTWTAGEDRVALIAAVPMDELRRLTEDLARRSPDHDA